ncbi:MPN domain-containing protein isoform X2 [Halyomorpha halys]|uniref:MPN domain-containing protein isoform X2 n=1 Tax=Halyomorpha halys TaxID=286706 RepID=UPI0006D50D54|nr:MPN domain-containing protein isoform X2 [Halyomorpha halys]
MIPLKMQRGSEEEVEGDVEDEEFIDEECSEEGEGDRRAKGAAIGRTITLQMLLAANILQPGEANMSIEYMGQRFLGDLLSDGKIKSLETDIIFASPSAWACHCKRMVNPDKKSGCGWASVKYQGQKLDYFKNKYFKQLQKGEDDVEEEAGDKASDPRLGKSCMGPGKSSAIDGNTLLEATPFSSLGKIQPFLVSISTNAALVIDFHCHLTTSEVVGYLAGHWDINAHVLCITAAYPCRCRLNDAELAPLVEEDIARAIEARRLSLIGWYHSHPNAPPTPTLRDVEAQLDYEIRMKGNSDAAYLPCIGFICSPYAEDSVSLESSLSSFWVIPPPESKPHDHGKPMLMTYSVIQDQFLSQDALNEMKKCSEFYRGDQDFINFNEKYKGNITYLEKMKASVSSKFPRDQSDGLLWSVLSELVCPPAPKPANPGYISTDIASALFATGKFPPALVSLFPPFIPGISQPPTSS